MEGYNVRATHTQPPLKNIWRDDNNLSRLDALFARILDYGVNVAGRQNPPRLRNPSAQVPYNSAHN